MVVCADALKLTRVRCFRHTLQLAINGALEFVSNISRTISASKPDLKKRFYLNTDDFCKSVNLVCTYLDPRYKSLPFLTEEQREIVINEVKSLSTVITGTSNEQHVNAANVSSNSGYDNSDAFELHHDKIQVTASAKNQVFKVNMKLSTIVSGKS
ncbi:hypothetical protein KUTeg_017456 [Tegillarca granosa]|uniref:Uncharacterized protein n=1 Tax=Tegillarca granosa TaxID=220873 RepID=A0ABQ9EEZ1_TEGGR|nr:hypothetical protein KUTeg_017456 [Tegillarca granosa]